MVIVQLLGGLGNQLFQYAAGRRISLKCNLPLKLDTAYLKYTVPKREYALGNFNIVEEFATAKEARRLKGYDGLRGIFSRWRNNRKPYHLRSYIQERHFHFDPDILKVSAGAYLSGYWQSEKYFADIAGTIRNEFTLRHLPDAYNAQMADEIMAADSVALHVRRLENVTMADRAAVQGTCSVDYYRMAVDRIVEAIPNPHFFIFSDDMLWVRENIRLDFPVTYIDKNYAAGKDSEDLRLMSLCKHNIIANSTFSWWGAWLNPNPQKVVITPRRWFNDQSYNASDLIPGGWHRL
jgi:hypothetical protein